MESREEPPAAGPALTYGRWSRPATGFCWRNDLRIDRFHDEKWTRRPVVGEKGLPSDYGLEQWMAARWEDPRPDDEFGPWLATYEPRPEAFKYLNLFGKQSTALLRDFERLSTDPTQDAILAFANRYGFLGRARLLCPDPLATEWIAGLLERGGHEPPPNPGPPPDPRATIWGESLATWREELAKFRGLRLLHIAATVLADRDLYTDNQVQEAEAFLSRRLGWERGPGGRNSIIVPALRRRGYPGGVESAELPWDERGPFNTRHASYEWVRMDNPQAIKTFVADDLAGPASLYVRDAIGRHLHGEISLAFTLPPNPMLRYLPSDLLSAIYILFAFEVGAGSDVRSLAVCDQCLQSFTRVRRDQRFCSARCRALAHYYRHPAKSGLGKAGEDTP